LGALDEQAGRCKLSLQSAYDPHPTLTSYLL
jgi:hypothetical protein